MSEAPNHPPPPVPGATAGQSRVWVVACHLSALSLFTPEPFAHILAPLTVWLLKRSESPDVDEHGKEAVNWQISFTLYGLGLGLVVVALFLFAILPILGLISFHSSSWRQASDLSSPLSISC